MFNAAPYLGKGTNTENLGVVEYTLQRIYQNQYTKAIKT